MSKQAISKYEKGLINPASDVLIALASALGLKVDRLRGFLAANSMKKKMTNLFLRVNLGPINEFE